MTDHSQPIDQPLTVEGVSALRIKFDDGTSIVRLELDVRHDDTGHQWKQGLTCHPDRVEEMHALLAHVIEDES